MINVNDVIALAGAGFNKEEIGQIIKATSEPQVQQAAPQVQQAAPQVQTQQPITAPLPGTVEQDKPAWVDDLLKSVNNISHMSNIAGMTTEVKQETTEDILANIINPYNNEEVSNKNG